MKATSFYPVLVVEDVAATASFYIDHLGFRPLFETAWYVHLQSAEDPTVNLAVLAADHETIPASDRPRSSVILNFEVEDVDAIHARALADGWTILKPLVDEDFGQRHFIARDPAGTLIDVISPIPPSPEFAALYASEALPR